MLTINMLQVKPVRAALPQKIRKSTREFVLDLRVCLREMLRNFPDAFGKTVFQPAFRLEKLLGTSRKFRRRVRAEVCGKKPRLLRSCLGVEISIRNPSEANFSKNFASEPPKLLRSASRCSSMWKLVLVLSYIGGLFIFWWVQNDPANFLHRVSHGASPRGRQLYFTFPSALEPFFKASNGSFLTLRVATP